jgi:hypothetical protein
MTTLFGHPRDLPASAFAKAESPFRDRGTDDSNPSPSSGESAAKYGRVEVQLHHAPGAVAPVVRTLALTRPAAGRRDIGEMIERKEVVKGYEFDRGQFVTFHALRAEGPRYRELADDRVVGPGDRRVRVYSLAALREVLV